MVTQSPMYVRAEKPVGLTVEDCTREGEHEVAARAEGERAEGEGRMYVG